MNSPSLWLMLSLLLSRSLLPPLTLSLLASLFVTVVITIDVAMAVSFAFSLSLFALTLPCLYHTTASWHRDNPTWLYSLTLYVFQSLILYLCTLSCLHMAPLKLLSLSFFEQEVIRVGFSFFNNLSFWG